MTQSTNPLTPLSMPSPPSLSATETTVNDLGELRRELDAVDTDLVTTLARRMQLIRRTAELKSMTTHQVRDSLREEEMLARLGRQAESVGLPPYFVTSIFREILDYSVRCQGDHLVGEIATEPSTAGLTVGYQGVEGAYSLNAGKKHFQESRRATEFRGFFSFRDLLEAVDQGRIDRAVLPIENTTAGSINEAYDLLATLPLSVVGEEILLIDHCLIVLDETVQLEEIRTVTSHPQALAQCTNFLGSTEGLVVEPGPDTAMAVERLISEGDRTLAAIASREAADRHGGHVLRRELANQKNNYTRFLIISKTPVRVDPRVPAKTSVLFQVAHQPGALLRCLAALDGHGINLTKLESRPVLDAPWTYRFYADLDANLESLEVQKALSEMTQSTVNLRVLGCYPKRPRP
ncbi:MAG: bifunctional chorismate mutase/prephenate dehydratase [Thermoanaerobaculia bacterium]|nr:bifunctional chorismate mutase/prephenate dehydratase [Thermoanaerobaculia bacterium]